MRDPLVNLLKRIGKQISGVRLWGLEAKHEFRRVLKVEFERPSEAPVTTPAVAEAGRSYVASGTRRRKRPRRNQLGMCRQRRDARRVHKRKEYAHRTQVAEKRREKKERATKRGNERKEAKAKAMVTPAGGFTLWGGVGRMEVDAMAEDVVKRMGEPRVERIVKHTGLLNDRGELLPDTRHAPGAPCLHCPPSLTSVLRAGKEASWERWKTEEQERKEGILAEGSSAPAPPPPPPPPPPGVPGPPPPPPFGGPPASFVRCERCGGLWDVKFRRLEGRSGRFCGECMGYVRCE